MSFSLLWAVFLLFFPTSNHTLPGSSIVFFFFLTGMCSARVFEVLLRVSQFLFLIHSNNKRRFAELESRGPTGRRTEHTSLGASIDVFVKSAIHKSRSRPGLPALGHDSEFKLRVSERTSFLWPWFPSLRFGFRFRFWGFRCVPFSLV